MEGEAREDILADVYSRQLGHRHEKMPGVSDIDRVALDEKGNKLYFFEIKERSCTINAYKHTMFPYAKIEEAKRLISARKLPVYIVLKFADCWARHKVDLNREYRIGKEPFAPKYRPWQRKLKRQIPVLLDVEEDLEILPKISSLRTKPDLPEVRGQGEEDVMI
jgi:hypothetical protein